MDVTHIPCNTDGWDHLAAVLGCHDREIAGREFALRDRAREADCPLEPGCLRRLRISRPVGDTLFVRAGNGLSFQSGRFRAACRDCRFSQEFITPYTFEQLGRIERFFRSLKEECVCWCAFHSLEETRTAIGRWIRDYNEHRRPPAFTPPAQFRVQRQRQVA